MVSAGCNVSNAVENTVKLDLNIEGLTTLTQCHDSMDVGTRIILASLTSSQGDSTLIRTRGLGEFTTDRSHSRLQTTSRHSEKMSTKKRKN